MGATKDKVKGKANELAGKTEATAGKQSGSKKTEAKGAAKVVKGKAQQTAGKAKSAVKK